MYNSVMQVHLTLVCFQSIIKIHVKSQLLKSRGSYIGTTILLFEDKNVSFKSCKSNKKKDFAYKKPFTVLELLLEKL